MDHSATTPVHPEVFLAMKPYLNDMYANPSSVHGAGRVVRQGLEGARDQVAKLINADQREIVFTSGGTEADNQAILGFLDANSMKGDLIITDSTEHHAVLDTFKYAKRRGSSVVILPVDEFGVLQPETLRAAMNGKTRLVSVMHANNEIGTIQPIRELAAIAHEYGAIFHTDAVQTAGRIPVDVKDLGVDMLSVSAHKLYGPKGIGCLYVRKGLRVARLLHGGGQERNLRAGTENVAGIIGFGKAVEIAQAEMSGTGRRLETLGRKLTEGLLKVPHTRLTGHPTRRIPGHVSVCFEFVEGESILLMLDHLGIMASSGSACTSGSLDPSHVLLAIGLPHEIAHGSLRLSMGRGNTEEDVDYALEVIPKVIERLRSMSPLVREAGAR